LLVVRATVVVNPDPQRESQRLWNVVQPFMQRTCKGPFAVLENNLADEVNLYIRFRCGA
jgi:ribulose bisphosphate carboxylase small subunit